MKEEDNVEIAVCIKKQTAAYCILLYVPVIPWIRKTVRNALGHFLIHPALPHPMQHDEPRLCSLLIPGFRDCHCSHTPFSPIAVLSFLPLLPYCLLPKQQVHHSQHFHPPPCNNSSSMHLSAAVSSSSTVCSSLYSPRSNFHCTGSSISSDTPVISQVLQLLPHIRLVPIHQVPSSFRLPPTSSQLKWTFWDTL